MQNANAYNTFRWRPRALLQRKLHVELLRADGHQVRPPPSSETPPTEPEIPELVSPVEIAIDRFAIDKLTIRQKVGRPV